jgi:hypothetical protein
MDSIADSATPRMTEAKIGQPQFHPPLRRSSNSPDGEFLRILGFTFPLVTAIEVQRHAGYLACIAR